MAIIFGISVLSLHVIVSCPVLHDLKETISNQYFQDAASKKNVSRKCMAGSKAQVKVLQLSVSFRSTQFSKKWEEGGGRAEASPVEMCWLNYATAFHLFRKHKETFLIPLGNISNVFSISFFSKDT